MNIAIIFIVMILLVPFIGAVLLEYFPSNQDKKNYFTSEGYLVGFSLGQLLLIKVATLLGVFGWINFDSIISIFLVILLLAVILDWRKDWKVSISWYEIFNSYQNSKIKKITWSIGIIFFLLITALIVDINPPRHADMLRYHLEYSNYILNSGSLPFVPHNQLALASDAELLFSMVTILLGSTYVKLAVYINLLFCIYAVFIYFQSFTKRLAKYAIIFFIASPILFLASTIVKPDTIQLLYFVVSLFLIEKLYQKFTITNLFLIAIFIGEVVSLKWTGLLPILSLTVYLFFLLLIKAENRKTLISLIFAIGIGIVILPLYWYLRNYFATGNPIWPLMNDLFVAKDTSLMYEISSHGSSRAGKIEMWGIASYFYYTFFLYMPSLLGGLGVSYYLSLPLAIHKDVDKKIIYNFVFVIIYMTIWYLTQASFRHLIWILPFIAVISGYGYSRSKSWKYGVLKYFSKIIVCLILFQILFITIYSTFYVKHTLGIVSNDSYYATTPNFHAFSRAEKDINNSLKKVLVIIPGSEIYYFNQPHIDGNRTYSAIIDYYINDSFELLSNKLMELDIDYIFFESELIKQQIYFGLRKIIENSSTEINNYTSKVVKNRLTGKTITMQLTLVELNHD
jgi:hypothetical protein